MIRGHQRHSYPHDKGVPIEAMRRSKMIILNMFDNGHWIQEKKKASDSTIGKTIKKMHKKKRRQWERLIENKH